jgi:hypothetical protein
LKTAIQKDLQPLLAAYRKPQIFYFKDSTFFFGNSAQNKLDSIKLRLSDFILADEVIFKKEGSASTFYYILAAAIIVAMTAYMTVVKMKRNKKPATLKDSLAQDEPSTNGSHKSFETTLTETELQVFKLILKNSLQGEVTTIDQLNQALGVSKKNNETQKKQRSDTIISINSKYVLVSGNEESLIDKRRCEFDKRSYEYFIQFEKTKQFENETLRI